VKLDFLIVELVERVSARSRRAEVRRPVLDVEAIVSYPPAKRVRLTRTSVHPPNRAAPEENSPFFIDQPVFHVAARALGDRILTGLSRLFMSTVTTAPPRLTP